MVTGGRGRIRLVAESEKGSSTKCDVTHDRWFPEIRAALPGNSVGRNMRPVRSIAHFCFHSYKSPVAIGDTRSDEVRSALGPKHSIWRAISCPAADTDK